MPGLAAPPAPVTARKPKSKTRQLQWEKTGSALKDTIWEQIDTATWEATLDFAQIEEEFRLDAGKAGSAPGGDVRRPSAAGTLLNLMDTKKARNMQIVLGGLRLTPVELRSALLRMDEDVWSESLVHELLKYLPSAAETEEIVRYYRNAENAASASAATPERIVFELSKVHGLAERLATIEVKASIGTWFAEASSQLDALLRGLCALQESARLPAFMGLVLVLGNFLNAGTFKAGARGFTVESLNKLREARSADMKSNLLAYALRVLRAHRPDVLALGEELLACVDAQRVSLEYWMDVAEDKRRLIARLHGLLRAHVHGQHQALNGGSIDRYAGVVEPFLQAAEEELRAVDQQLQACADAFSRALRYFADGGSLRTPKDLLGVFADFCADFDRFRGDLLAASHAQPVLGVLDEAATRTLLDSVIDAARTV